MGHPGDSCEPSTVDERTFKESFGSADWAVMMIMSKTGKFYCRMRMTTGGLTTNIHLPVVMTFSHPFPAADHAKWDAELKEKVTARTGAPAPFTAAPEATSRWGKPSDARIVFGGKPRKNRTPTQPVVERTTTATQPPVGNPMGGFMTGRFPGGHWSTGLDGRPVPAFYGYRSLTTASMAPQYGLYAYLLKLGLKYQPATTSHDGQLMFFYRDKLYSWSAVLGGLIEEGRAKIVIADAYTPPQNKQAPPINPVEVAKLRQVLMDILTPLRKDTRAYDIITYENGEEVLASMRLPVTDKEWLYVSKLEAEVYTEINNGDLRSEVNVRHLLKDLLTGSQAFEDPFNLNKDISGDWYNAMIECGVTPDKAAIWSRVQTIAQLKDCMPEDQFKLFFKTWESIPVGGDK